MSMDETSTALPFATSSPAQAIPDRSRTGVTLPRKDAGALVLVLLIALGIIYTAAAVQESAAMHRQAVAINTRLQMQAYHQNALEWQARARGEVTPKIAAERQEVVSAMQADLTTLEQLEERGALLDRFFSSGEAHHEHLDETAGALESYQAALDREFGFLIEGDLKAAEEVDKAEVGPAFERLSEVIGNTILMNERDAAKMSRTASMTEGLVVTLVVLLAGWLLRRLERSRRLTALVAAEQRALRETNVLVKHASDIIARLDRNGAAQFLSPAVESILGGQPKDLLRQTFWSHVHPGDSEHARHFHEQLLKQPGRGQLLELNFVHRNGSKRVLELRGTNLLDDPEVGAIVLNARDITERKRLEGRLEQQALHDALTGFPNRRLFVDRLEHALSRSHRHRQPVAVMFLDLDRFKLINDTLGHDMGDRLLMMVADRIKVCLRVEDTVARLGGDEFTVLIEEVTDQYSPVEVAKRIIAVFEEPFDLSGHEVTVGTSIGIVQSVGAESSPSDMLRDADVAMYRAKQNGKGRYECYDASMAMAAPEQLKLEGDLRRALKQSGAENSEFVLHYQPLVDLKTGETVAFEALVRWQHPERGLLAPDHFIPLAEETGLIVALGQWVLETACRQAIAFQAQLGAAPPMAVNLSLKQLAFCKRRVCARTCWSSRSPKATSWRM
jgi:diguanylate cyclase (GGDEF)-like protein/PAS domain S-box-containing protein